MTRALSAAPNPKEKMKRARVEKEGTLGLLGLNEDGAVLMGAKTAAFAGCRVNDVLPEQSDQQHACTIEEFQAARSDDAALRAQLRNTIKKCGSCGKVCGFSLKICNSCGAALPGEGATPAVKAQLRDHPRGRGSWLTSANRA